MKLILLCGIPGSGKSTLAKKLASGGFIVLSSDAIREELYGSESILGDPAQVFNKLNGRMRRAMMDKQNIVIDATNIRRRDRKVYRVYANTYGYQIYIWVLPTNLDRAVKQNFQRERHVPIEVICRMRETLMNNYPTEDEGIVVDFNL